MIETTILAALIGDEEYTRKVLPFIDSEYFDQLEHKIVFEDIRQYVGQYNALPTQTVLKIALDDREDVNQQTYDDASRLIAALKHDSNTDQQWFSLS